MMSNFRTATALTALVLSTLCPSAFSQGIVNVSNPRIFKSISERINPPLVPGADGNFYGTTNEGGDFGRGSLIQISPTTGARTVLYSFQGGTDGAFPIYGLTRQSAGFFYGVTTSSGSGNAGTLFRYSASTSFQRLLSFEPTATGFPIGLWAAATDGTVYGLTGDSLSGPSVIQLRRYRNNNLQTLFEFNSPELPINGVTIDNSGNCFFYTYNPATVQTKVWRFDAIAEVTSLYATIDSPSQPIGVPAFLNDGRLRGTSAVGGANSHGFIFNVGIDGTSSTIHDFERGAEGSPVDRQLYPQNFDTGHFNWSGTVDSADDIFSANADGGPSNNGTIWKITKDGAFAVVNPVENILNLDDVISTALNNDSLFATANTLPPTLDRGAFATVNKFVGLMNVLNPGPGVTAPQTLVYDSIGGSPNRFMARAPDGSIFGTTNIGGTYNRGLLFRVGADGQVFDVFHFGGPSEIENPREGLILLGDFLYGVGSDGLNEVIFRYRPGGAEDPAVFVAIEDAVDLNLPVRSNTGNFFVTCRFGGDFDSGKVYRITAQGILDTTFPSFEESTSGQAPDGPLLIGTDGNFYGVCQFGGENSAGTVFRTTATGSELTALASFESATTGENPVGPLVEVLTSGNVAVLYGMTQFSTGTGTGGKIFSATLSGQSAVVTDAATIAGGFFAQAGLTKGSDGNLYGLTGIGGAGGGGSLLRFVPSSSSLSILAGLSVAANGMLPGQPVQRADGSLLVASNAGGSFTDGTLARFAPVVSVLPPPAITSGLSANPSLSQNFSYQIAATNQPSAFNASNLPPGLSVDQTTGLISGIPTTTGVFDVVISASNSPTQTGTAILRLAVTTVPIPVIAPGQSVSATVGLEVSYQVQATNSPTSFSASGLPAGMTINNSGVISGTPFVDGQFTVAVTATNAGGGSTQDVNITVQPPTTLPPVIRPGQSADGTVGTAFNYTVICANNPVSFEASGLPAGLAINDLGIISGIPTQIGRFFVEVTATNVGGTDTENVIIDIEEVSQPPVVQLGSVPSSSKRPTVTIRGSAFGSEDIVAIVATLNNVPISASGLNNFRIRAKLKKGNNTVRVFAIDSEGNESDTVTAKIRFKPKKKKTRR